MGDEVRRLSGELASDPASRAYLRLGELLRQRGDLDGAARIAARGRDRHPHDPEAHDLVARIAVDADDVRTAAQAWEHTVRLDPAHAGARKGLAFVAFREGRLAEALVHLETAARLAPNDASIMAALTQVRGAAATASVAPPAAAVAPVFARRSSIGSELFADLESEDSTILCLDANGRVLSGAAPADAAGRSAGLGRSLSGVSDEATRATRHLGLGPWTMLTIEAELASAVIAPAPGDGVVLVSAPPPVALGSVRRVLAQAVLRLAGQGDGRTDA